MSTQVLQNRLSEASKQLAPLQNFRLHFQDCKSRLQVDLKLTEARAEAKKKMQGLERSMGEVELEAHDFFSSLI